MSTQRTLDELLVAPNDDAISLVTEWVQKGNKSCHFHEQCNDDDEENCFRNVCHELILVSTASANRGEDFSATNEDGADEILKLQMTTKSPLGAMAFHCRILFAYNGLIRVLGAGNKKTGLRSISSWTQHCQRSGFLPQGGLLIADDIFGGFFALNGGAFPQSKLGHVCYLPPDSLVSGVQAWEDTELSYTSFFSEWLMDAQRVYLWYSSWFFQNWFDVIKQVGLDREACKVFSLYPPLWSKEASTADPNFLSRKVVSIEEIWSLRHTPFTNSVADMREKEEKENNLLNNKQSKNRNSENDGDDEDHDDVE